MKKEPQKLKIPPIHFNFQDYEPPKIVELRTVNANVSKLFAAVGVNKVTLFCLFMFVVICVLFLILLN